MKLRALEPRTVYEPNTKTQKAEKKRVEVTFRAPCYCRAGDAWLEEMRRRW